MISNKVSEEEDYHVVTGPNRQLHKQSSQNPQSSNDTTGYHADHDTSNSTAKPLESNKNWRMETHNLHLFHPKVH